MELSAKDVLVVAIHMEARNADYYVELAEAIHVSENEAKTTLREFAADEREHLEILMKLWREKYNEEPVPRVTAIDIDDIPELIEFDVGPDGIGAHEVMQAAKQAEMTACFFYERSAETVKDDEVRQLMLKLAAMELTHLERLDPDA